MDLAAIIRQRLEQLGLEEEDLAIASEVTESYISQLLTRKKAPPEPTRTDNYGKIEDFLKVRRGEIVKPVQMQRREELKRKLVDPPPPLFKEVRELVLRKCKSGKQKQVRVIFERQPFGELEFLVTQKLLDVVKGVAMQELEKGERLRIVGSLNGRSYEETRVTVLEFLDVDVLNVSPEHCATFLDPLIESWDIDLANFDLEITLNRRVVPGYMKRFVFIERPGGLGEDEPGLKQFLQDTSFSKGATEEEIECLRALKLNGRRPTPPFYYRELQNLRDPLHFRDAGERGPGGREAATLTENATRSAPPVVSLCGPFHKVSGPLYSES